MVDPMLRITKRSSDHLVLSCPVLSDPGPILCFPVRGVSSRLN